MEVTVYVEEEKIGMITEPDKWKAKVEELGLAGQLKLVDGDEKPNPFMRMDTSLIRCFETLCPTKKHIGDFDSEAIPMEALGAYGLAVRDKHFEEVEIWYSPGQADPVMVGTSKKGKTEEHFLMARWGPEKLSLDELMVKAKKKWISKATQKLKQSMEDFKNKLGRVDELADEHFRGEWVYIG